VWILSVEDKCGADHVVVAHFYHDTYILQLIANAKRGVGWEQIEQELAVLRYDEWNRRGFALSG
jgi:hypothetical protein